MSRYTPKIVGAMDVKEKMFNVGMKTVCRPTLTYGKAKEILNKAKEKGFQGMAKVNKSLTKEQAFNILYAGVNEKPDEECMHFLAAKNIVREFI